MIAGAKGIAPAELEKLVKLALRLIEPIKEQRDDCREAINDRFVEMIYCNVQEYWSDYAKTKIAKRAAARLATAFRRLEVVLKDPSLDLELQLRFPVGEISKNRKLCDLLARQPTAKLSRKTAAAKRRAVHNAYSLLEQFASHGQSIDAKKNGQFFRLSATLFGEPHADLQSQCQAYIRGKKRGSY